MRRRGPDSTFCAIMLHDERQKNGRDHDEPPILVSVNQTWETQQWTRAELVGGSDRRGPRGTLGESRACRGSGGRARDCNFYMSVLTFTRTLISGPHL